jgi:hypothetical protein
MRKLDGSLEVEEKAGPDVGDAQQSSHFLLLETIVTAE